METYKITAFKTGFFSGTLNPKKMTQILNQHDQESWELDRTIHETSRVLLLFRRETHFLIFKRKPSN